MPSRPFATSDEDLMRRVQGGETAAFAKLFDRHIGRAQGVARSICRDAGRAEDAVQEAFLDMWRSRHDYRANRGSFNAWAMTLVRHRAIDRVRSEATRPQLVGVHREPGEEHSRSAQDHAVTRDESESLRKLVRKLPREQVEVIALAFFGELTHSEIASELNLPLGTVKGRMRLGLERLRIETETRNALTAGRDGLPSTLPSGRRRFRRRPNAPQALRRDSRP